MSIRAARDVRLFIIIGEAMTKAAIDDAELSVSRASTVT